MKEIILFNKVLDNNYCSTVNSHEDIQDIVEIASKKGIIIDPQADMSRVYKYLQTLPNNYTTLHTSFEAVRNTPECVLYMQQLAHYMSTYGTNHQGDVYLPSFGKCDINLKEVRYLDVISWQELEKSLQSLIESGIALDNGTIDSIIELMNELEFHFPASMSNNKELTVRLMIENKNMPDNTDQMMRIINYLLAGSTTVVKNPTNIALYRQNISDNIHYIRPMFDSLGLIEVSHIFNRYKPLFLAMKKDNKMKPIINKLSKLSKEHHIPMVKPFASKFLCLDYLKEVHKLSKQDDIVQGRKELRKYIHAVKHLIDDANIFQLEKYARLVRRKMTILNPSEDDYNVYNIRNGKVYVKKSNISIEDDGTVMMQFIMRTVSDMIESKLKKAVLSKLDNKTLLLPEMDYVLPTSKKDFIGHIPYGSSIDLDNWNNIQFGIHWTNKDCGEDLDLSLACSDGTEISWNTNQKVDGITHTGDMTNADPEAAELISITHPILPECSIVVNPYFTKPNAEFTFFIAKNADLSIDAVDRTNKCLSDEGNIIFSCKLKIDGQLNIGYISGGRFYFSGRETGKGRVRSWSLWDTCMTVAEINKMKSFTKIKDIYSEPFTEDTECVDLTTKDTTALIELLS